MDLFEVLRCAPTTRSFRADPPPLEAVYRALEVARFAPSGGNRQPWRVVVVSDAAKRRRLQELYLPHWRTYLERMGAAPLLGRAEADPRLRSLAAANHFAESLAEVPYHLTVWAELAAIAFVDEGLPRRSLVGGASVYPFVQNLLLALRGEGLGAALTTLLAPAEAEVKELLGVPDGLALAAYVLCGWRAEPWPKRLARRPVEEFAFLDSYGEPLAKPPSSS